MARGKKYKRNLIKRIKQLTNAYSNEELSSKSIDVLEILLIVYEQRYLETNGIDPDEVSPSEIKEISRRYPKQTYYTEKKSLFEEAKQYDQNLRKMSQVSVPRLRRILADHYEDEFKTQYQNSVRNLLEQEYDPNFAESKERLGAVNEEQYNEEEEMRLDNTDQETLDQIKYDFQSIRNELKRQDEDDDKKEIALEYDGITIKIWKTLLNEIPDDLPGYLTVLEVKSNGAQNTVFYTLNQTTREELRSTKIINYDTEDLTSSESLINNLRKIQTVTVRFVPIEDIRRRARQRRNRGGFFPYLNKSIIKLERYQIYRTIKKENYRVNCLVYAFEQSGDFEQKDIENLKTMVTEKHIPVDKLYEIADELECNIKLLKENDRARWFPRNRPHDQDIEIGLIDDHFFLNEKTDYTSYAIKHYKQVKKQDNWGTLTTSERHDSSKTIDSFKLIKLMKEHNLFEPMDMSTENIMDTQFYNKVSQEIEELEYNEKAVREINLGKIKKHDGEIYYADFETTTDGEIHMPYMCCVVTDEKNKGYKSTGTKEEKTFIGEYCGKQLLDYLPNKALIYFHNFGYDFAFIVKYLCITSLIKTGSQIKMVKATYKQKHFIFKDSLAMIGEPLKKFTKMFSLDSKKEIMPYGLYTEDTVGLNSVPFEECKAHISVKDWPEFEELSKPYVFNGDFNLIGYAKFYCLQDCRLLMQGMKKFNEWMLTAFKLSVYDFISLPSLAYRYLYKEGCFDDVYELSGIPRLFIQQCVKGGRCMTRDNKKWYVKEEINDFDAVSLYPSAMSRMGFLKGKPKVLQENQLNMEFLSQQSGYFIEIKNLFVLRDRHFPLQSEMTEQGIRNYTNEFFKNVYVDKVSLEDLIEFQDAQFDIVRGYYFTDGRNYKIKDTITKCFNQRLIKKQEKNPIEQVYKLLMNASYGKMIQKPIKHNIRFSNTKKQHQKFLSYNHNFINEFTRVAKDKYVYKVQKSILKHFNSAHCGTEILSMSKRIMNEVMCLAEDIGCQIYYQDTDSMHISDEDIKRLANAFTEKYGRELVGNNMGQFHSDFSVKDKRNPEKAIDDLVAVKCIFLGKKAYIDNLTCRNTDLIQYMKTNYHFRMKGITQEAIQASGDPFEIYEKLYDGEKIMFDLAKTKVLFKRNKDFSYETNEEFKRSVNFI